MEQYIFKNALKHTASRWWHLLRGMNKFWSLSGVDIARFSTSAAFHRVS